MTEKIKHKYADAICALMNGEIIEAKAKYDGHSGWVNVELYDDSDNYVLMNNSIKNGLWFLLEHFELRLKHPHQALIDQCEADPTLEVEVWDAYWDTENDYGYRWRPSTVKEMKGNTEGGFAFRIKEKAPHPHQPLIDKIERGEITFPCYVRRKNKSLFDWVAFKKDELIPYLIKHSDCPFEIYAFAAESKGAEE